MLQEVEENAIERLRLLHVQQVSTIGYLGLLPLWQIVKHLGTAPMFVGSMEEERRYVGSLLFQGFPSLSGIVATCLFVEGLPSGPFFHHAGQRFAYAFPLCATGVHQGLNPLFLVVVDTFLTELLDLLVALGRLLRSHRFVRS